MWLVIGYYVIAIVAFIGLLIWAISSRVKEKEVEKEKHKDYDKY